MQKVMKKDKKQRKDFKTIVSKSVDGAEKVV